MKNFLKQFKVSHKIFLYFRQKLRVIYNTKTRSRFLWNLRDGDNSLTLKYPLNQNSVVFDVGAYKGVFTKKIFKKFNCKVYAFEPLKIYFEELSNYFENNKDNVKIFNFGLLDKDTVVNFSNIDGASSIYSRAEGKLSSRVQMKSFIKFVNENHIKNIDLVYMNIEGSEYQLMNQIIDTGYISNINFIQIQFHNFVDNSKENRKYIREKLSETHECIFNFPFVWESWKLKS